jgi:hypothetical protein
LNISGITQLAKDENCKAIVNKFLKLLVPSHDDNTLDICHRTAGGQLICRFTSRTARDAIYAERKQLKDKTTEMFNLPGLGKVILALFFHSLYHVVENGR